MLRAVTISALVAMASLLCAGCAAGDKSTGFNDNRGFTTLFDGTGFEGWEVIVEEGHPLKDDAWFIQDGTLGCTGYGWHWFRYTEPVGDCVLRLEYKTAKDSNSGVCLRSKKEGAPPFTGFEVQILGDHGKDPDKHSTGSIYDIVTPMYNAARPDGEWNQLEITVKGTAVKVVLNGRKVIDTDFAALTSPIGKFNFAYADMPRIGYIALQDHWTPIWYRNIRIKKL